MPFEPHDVFFEDFARYWGAGVEALRALPLHQAILPTHEPLPPRLTVVRLPEWATDIGVDGNILIPAHLAPGSDNWEDVDWPLAGFWYVHGLAERAFESRHGPIHSYAFRLKGWDERMWRYAWANRMALFLRCWAACRLGRTEQDLFGPLPEPELILTHDIDAIKKTIPVRIKHSVFMLSNILRRNEEHNKRNTATQLLAAIKHLIRKDDYWCFDQIQVLESQYGMTSWFFVYGGRGGKWRSPKDILFDPGYAVDGSRLARQLILLRDSGHTIGLHQAFGSWNDRERMLTEKRRLETVLKQTIHAGRQHWLRFSWKQTWVTQAAAGLKLDCTLGFNDQPGFRNGAALRHNPLTPDLSSRLDIESLPMVIMDSHFYGRVNQVETSMAARLRHWVDEIMAVRGQATVIWHQQAFSRDYGWQGGYEALLALSSGYSRGQGVAQ